MIKALEEGEFVNIIIEDNGIGMDERTVDTLFQVGKSNSSVGTKGELGTGLGLLLCKELIHKIDGEISVESTLGVGSTFYLKFKK